MNKKFLNTHAIFSGIILTLFTVPCLGEEVSAQSPLPTSESAETYFKSLISLNYSMPKIAQGVQREKGKYIVIFIPGILGSKLTDPQKGIIWGGKAEPDLESLRLSKDSPYATAEIMQEYPGFWSRQDIYGKFDRALKIIAAGAAKTLEFPYDWRQDLNVVTQKLDEYIRAKESELRGKNVIFIAHSMGGLVFFNWKNKFFENEKKKFDYTFLIYKALLLGSPLKGSCEMLRMLLTGYRPVPDAGILEKIGYRYLFSDVQGALFTFPSIFQLIPHIDMRSPKNSCLIFRTQDDDMAKNPFDKDVWDLLLTLGNLKDIWNKLGISRTDFEKLLKKSESFRIELNNNLRENRLQGRILYFYNDTHATTEHVVVKFNDEYTDPEVINDDSTISEHGDGRVLLESATNAGEPGISRHLLHSGHGELVRDDTFFAFLKINLNQNIYGNLVKQIAPLVLKDSDATQQLASTGKILAFSALGEDPMEPKKFHDGTKAVHQLNLRVVEALTKDEKGMESQPSFSTVSDLGKRAYNYAKYLDDKLEDSTGAIPLYEIAMASGKLEGNLHKVYTLNRYGYALLRNDRFQEAERALSSARSAFEVSPFNFPKDFAGKLYNNLGNVYLRTKKPIYAIESLRRASEYGSMKAAAALHRMEQLI